MQITDFTFTKLELTPVGDNLWKLAKDVRIQVNAPAGKGWRFTLKEGFVTNLRSGSDLINPVIPRMGNEGRTLCYILHDANYTWLGITSSYHCMEKKDADALLKAMLAFCDDCDRFQIAELKRLGAKDFKSEIKQLKKDILGSFKIWCICKALALFGNGAYQEKNPPPYDKNCDKVFMEVL
jgi:hypothetical protein